MQHSEARTASVSLYQFHAANTIYNITESCNTLEIYTKFVDISGVETQTATTTVTIPIGYYNITNLISVLNQKIHQAQYNSTNGSNVRAFVSGYYPGLWGDQISTNIGNVASGSIFIPAVCLDNYVTQFSTVDGAGNEVANMDYTFNRTNKVKFCTPRLDDLKVENVNKSTYLRFYGGVYLIASNYSGLLEKLGFPFSSSYALPLVSGARGFGINFTMKTAPATNGNASQCNVSYEIQNTSQNVFADNNQFTNVTLDKGPTYSYFTVGSLLANSWTELDYPRSIYVSIDSIITRNRCSNSKFPFGSIFARIPTANTVGTATGFGQIICYEPYESHEIFVPGLNMDQITIRLYDETGNPINWNGGHWSMTLTVRHNIDVGSAGMEDSSLGRTYRPYLQGTDHDQLQTKKEFHHKRIRF